MDGAATSRCRRGWPRYACLCGSDRYALLDFRQKRGGILPTLFFANGAETGRLWKKGRWIMVQRTQWNFGNIPSTFLLLFQCDSTKWHFGWFVCDLRGLGQRERHRRNHQENSPRNIGRRDLRVFVGQQQQHNYHHGHLDINNAYFSRYFTQED